MIRVGFIGCGRIADLHAAGYRDNPEARIHAVCDTDRRRAEERKAQWGAAKVFTDYRELLADREIDAVEILTPHETHEELVMAAMQAGKHVASQKPISVNLASANRIVAAAERAGVVYRCSENYVHYPPIVLARKMIDEGEIGAPVSIRIKYICSPIGGWDVPAWNYEWRLREVAAGRGMETFDHGHHFWSTAWYLGGPVERLAAWIDSMDGVIDCPSVVMWKYRADKRYGVIDMPYCADLHIPSKYYSNDEWVEINGSRGIILIHRCTGNIVEGPAVSVFNGHGWKQYSDVPSDWVEGFVGATRNFIAAIQGREKPLLSAVEGREILRFALAIHRSATLRREVYLDEMERRWPALFSWRKRRAEAKEFFLAGKGGGRGPGGKLSKYAPQARVLTEQLMGRFDPGLQRGWEASVGLHLTADGGVKEQKFAITIADGRAELRGDGLPEKADLVLRMPAGVWAAILLKKKRLEMALLQKQIQFEGRGVEGLKLRNAFRI